MTEIICVRCRWVIKFLEDRRPDRCTNCHVGLDRPVRKIRRRNIGGKRGRNYGKTRSSKNK